MTADDLQVRALMFAPQHARAIVLTVFRSSLLQNLLEDELHGQWPMRSVGHRRLHVSVFRGHGERQLSSTGACDAAAAVAVIAWPACYPSEPSSVTGYLVHMLRVRCVPGHRVQQTGQQSSR